VRSGWKWLNALASFWKRWIARAVVSHHALFAEAMRTEAAAAWGQKRCAVWWLRPVAGMKNTLC